MRNKTEVMIWITFKELLVQNPELFLQFQYSENKRVNASYHLTEIKQATITSVDCGGKMNAWTEVIIQLWEPGEKQQERAMTAGKALSIIELVEKSLPIIPNGTLKVEFGNDGFDVRQMLPNKITIEGEDLVIDLDPDSVQCKAIVRGGSCGTTASGEECCTPEATEKPKKDLKKLAVADTCCTPGSGCC